ncbi:hypothetical protein Tco_0578987 [Tanacetum coccineum]
MTPSTRLTCGNNNGEEVVKQYVDDAMAEICYGRGGFLSVISSSLLKRHADDEKVRIVSIHLLDKALLWHREYMQKHWEVVGWKSIKRP